MKKIKLVILDFDDIHNPLLGAGQARATFEVGTILAKKGFDITVISSRYPGYQDRVERGIYYRHIGIGTNNIKLNNLIYILTLPFTVRKIKADIIIECFTAPISTLMSPLVTQIPVIGLPTSFEADELAKKYHLPFHLIERIGCRAYKYFLPFSQEMDRKMKQINPGIYSCIVPLGVNQKYFHLQKCLPRYILFLGRLDLNQKGIDLLLKAYSIIKRQVSLPLVIAGAGEEENTIKKLIAKLNLTKDVKLVGRVSGKNKLDMIAKAAVLALPSRRETFCLTLLEAQAVGIPVIVFDIPGLSWANSTAILKSKPFDITAYSQNILQAVRSNKTKKTEVAARKFANKFTWEKTAEDYAKYIKEIIND